MMYDKQAPQKSKTPHTVPSSWRLEMCEYKSNGLKYLCYLIYLFSILLCFVFFLLCIYIVVVFVSPFILCLYSVRSSDILYMICFLLGLFFFFTLLFSFCLWFGIIFIYFLFYLLIYFSFNLYFVCTRRVHWHCFTIRSQAIKHFCA